MPWFISFNFEIGRTSKPEPEEPHAYGEYARADLAYQDPTPRTMGFTTQNPD